MRFTNGALARAREIPVLRWRLVRSEAALLPAIVCAFDSPGPAWTRDTHLTKDGAGGSAGRKPACP